MQYAQLAADLVAKLELESPPVALAFVDAPPPGVPVLDRAGPSACTFWRWAEAEAFYAEALKILDELGLPFLVAGTYAVSAYTGIVRPTKDLDIFCKAGDYPRIIRHFQELGYKVSVEDERWLAKVHRDEHFFDVIFASSNGTMPVGDRWFENARRIELFGTEV